MMKRERIIDFHQHLCLNEDPSGDLLMLKLERSNVEKVLIHACPTEIWSHVGGNERVAEVVERFPDAVFGSVYVDPRDEREALETIRRYADKGFRCVKMFPPVGFYPDDPRLASVFELIADLGLPVLFHTGTVSKSDSGGGHVVKSKYARPIFVEALAATYPEANFVMAHMGFPWYEEAMDLACHSQFPNLYLDCSSPPTKRLFARGDSLFHRFDFRKIIYGSDSFGTLEEESLDFQDIVDKLKVNSDEREMFFRGTAEKLLNL